MPRLAAAVAVAAMAAAAAAVAPAAALQDDKCPGWEPDMSVVRDMLDTLMGALDDAELPYWVNYGTLLGVIREGGIIDGDDDADLGMDHKYLKQVWDSETVHEALAAKDFKLVRSNNNDYKVYPVREGCATKGMKKGYFKNCCENVDIFFYAREGKCMMRRCFDAADWGMACQEDIVKDSFPADYVSKIVKFGGPKTKASFGRQMPVPYHYNKYLSHVYGPTWNKKSGSKYPPGGRTGCDP